MRKFTRLFFPFFVFCLANCSISAQSPFPDAEIFLVPLIISGGEMECGIPRNITSRSGYDNQPCFGPDGNEIYYTSVHEDGQADIYRYDIQTKKTARITSTPESEFSATIMQGNKSISVVRVEKDSTQRLWSFPVAGGEPTVLFKTIDSIGYHAWLGTDTAAFFILTEPSSLQLAADGSSPHIFGIIAENIGRCIKKVPGKRAVAFVDKSEEGMYLLKTYDLSTKKFSLQAQCPGKSEDFIFLKDGSIVMGSKGKLFRCNPSKDITWESFADLGGQVENIGRLAISPDGKKIAVVGIIEKKNP